MLRATIVAAAAVASSVDDGHASMWQVPPNAADANLTIFKDGSADLRQQTRPQWLLVHHAEAGGCAAGLHRPQTNGQPCLWFNQGCSPGCKTCTGTNDHANKPLQPLCDSWPSRSRQLASGVKGCARGDTYASYKSDDALGVKLDSNSQHQVAAQLNALVKQTDEHDASRDGSAEQHDRTDARGDGDVEARQG
jgi:hypothetical protein